MNSRILLRIDKRWFLFVFSGWLWIVCKLWLWALVNRYAITNYCFNSLYYICQFVCTCNCSLTVNTALFKVANTLYCRNFRHLDIHRIYWKWYYNFNFLISVSILSSIPHKAKSNYYCKPMIFSTTIEVKIMVVQLKPIS